MRQGASSDAKDLKPLSGRYREAMRRLWPVFGAAAVFSAVVNVLMLTGSLYMLQIYDRVLSSGSVPTLLTLFGIVVVLYVVLALYDVARSRLLGRAAMRLDEDLGPDACDLWLSGQQRGVRHLSDLDTVRSFIASPAMRSFFDLPFVPLFLGVLFILHPYLGWLALGGAVIAALLALLGRAMTTGALRRGHGRSAAARDFADGSHRAADTLTAMGMRGAVIGRWRSLQSTALAETQEGSDPAEWASAASRSFRMLLQSAMLTAGAWLVLQGQITAGMIIAASILSGRALAPIDQIIGQWQSIGQAREANRRLKTAFSEASDRPARGTELPAPQGKLSVSKLTKFAPGKDGRRLLTQIDFQLAPGDGLGVIGSSACGKSTLAKCLVGAWSPDSGEIRLDGATFDQWDPARLGRHVGYLPQEVVLLSGTIRDNICRFDPEARDEDIIEAARMVGIHEMILNLPEGYDMEIAPGSAALSGGQVQRIGLARAIFGMPALVVLDEPNSNLDAEGDAALSKALSGLRAAGSTVIVMAHRPSAIASVNKVMVVRDGMVAEFGDKDEVLQKALSGKVPSAAKGGVRAVLPQSASSGQQARPASGDPQPTRLDPSKARPAPDDTQATRTAAATTQSPIQQSGTS